MLVDFSSGIVRFTQPFQEVKNTSDNSVSSPDVYVDYTPQTWRLTRDSAADNGPRAFIERTVMDTAANPGMGDVERHAVSFDRQLWVLWRKAPNSDKSSTIYYKTYRIGVDLSALGYPPIKMLPTGVPAVKPVIGGTGEIVYGPWEIDRTGRKIYFTQVDERYRSWSISHQRFLCLACG